MRRRGPDPRRCRPHPRRGEPEGSPLSPGAAALLLDGRVTEAELSRWTELLADERPRWRATAARLAAVSGATPLVPALVAALEKETQPSAVREEMTALGLLAPGAADEVLFRATERFPGTLDGHLARSLALRGRAALALAPRLSGLTVDLPSWGAYFAWATGDGRRHLDEAASAALATGAPAAWAAVLRLARDAEHVVEEATLARSLESPSAGVREATLLAPRAVGVPSAGCGIRARPRSRRRPGCTGFRRRARPARP